jgi:hypothetical protein
LTVTIGRLGKRGGIGHGLLEAGWHSSNNA